LARPATDGPVRLPLSGGGPDRAVTKPT